MAITALAKTTTRAPGSITEAQMENYFAVEPKNKPKVSFPTSAVWLFIFGGIALFTSFSRNGSCAFIPALILLGIGGFVAYRAYQPVRDFDALVEEYNNRNTITDSEFDTWLEWQQLLARNRACDRLNLDPDQLEAHTQVITDPLLIVGFGRGKYLGVTSERKFAIDESHKGADGFTRWRVNIFIWFLPQEHLLAVYQSGIDATLKDLVIDKTQEYFYQAVSGFTTEQTRVEVGEGYKTGVAISATSFSLSIDSGETISTPVRPIEAHLKVKDSGLEATVRSLRELLRNKKQQMLNNSGAPGYPPMGYPQPGYPPSGYGYPQPGYPPAGYGYPAPGSYPLPGYTPSGGPATGNDPTQPSALPMWPMPAGPYPTGYPQSDAQPVNPPPSEPSSRNDAP